jgi:SAM-dependent methyltransferase
MANEAEHKRWNDPYWSSVWPRREALTDAVTDVLLDRVSPSSGDRVLDVGSGAGAATMKMAGRVGPDGSVLGADISAPLVEFASARAQAAGVDNVRFERMDVQTDPICGGPFTVGMSQFGVLFFDEPVTAFGNIAAHLDHGATFGFSCWRSMAENPWFVGHAVANLLPAPPAPPPGKSPTGPFALADWERTGELLADAGFTDIACEAVSHNSSVPKNAVFDDEQLAFVGVPPDLLDDARRAVEENLEVFGDGSGTYTVPLAYWIVTAVRP